MKTGDRPGLELRALQERLTKLSEASLRINENLDFDSVLQDVVDSARNISDARYGGMTVLNDAGRFEQFVTLRLDGRGAPDSGGTARERPFIRVPERSERTTKDQQSSRVPEGP